MKRNLQILIMFAFALLSLSIISVPANAHEGMEHITGTVAAVTNSAVTVNTTNGKTLEVHVDAKTEYTRDKHESKLSDVKVGDRVVIHAMDTKGKMMAHEVELGSAKKK